MCWAHRCRLSGGFAPCGWLLVVFVHCLLWATHISMNKITMCLMLPMYYGWNSSRAACYSNIWIQISILQSLNIQDVCISLMAWMMPYTCVQRWVEVARVPLMAGVQLWLVTHNWANHFIPYTLVHYYRQSLSLSSTGCSFHIHHILKGHGETFNISMYSAQVSSWCTWSDYGCEVYL